MAKKQYALRNGMILKKQLCGRTYRLLVVKDGRDFRFKIDDRIFGSLTAAARYVCRDETRQISGPQFWNAPLAN
jgi:hypothetical protein